MRHKRCDRRRERYVTSSLIISLCLPWHLTDINFTTLHTGTPLLSYVSTVHIRSNINTRHSPKPVALNILLLHNKKKIKLPFCNISPPLLRRVVSMRQRSYVCSCQCVSLNSCLYVTLIGVSPGNSPNSLCSPKREWSCWWERHGLWGSDILWQLCHIISSLVEDTH